MVGVLWVDRVVAHMAAGLVADIEVDNLELVQFEAEHKEELETEYN